jgi:hypothetical protein
MPSLAWAITWSGVSKGRELNTGSAVLGQRRQLACNPSPKARAEERRRKGQRNPASEVTLEPWNSSFSRRSKSSLKTSFGLRTYRFGARLHPLCLIGTRGLSE